MSYTIHYGKYLDELTNEIPVEHIVSCDGLTYEIEPGKPGEPKVNEIRFTLANLEHDGTQRYDTTFFENNSRSQAEGGILPLQIFFKVTVTISGAVFTGIMNGRSYGKWDETVDITIQDIRGSITESKLRFFKPITLQNAYLLDKDDQGSADNPLNPGIDLNGDSFGHEMLTFQLHQEQDENQNPYREPTEPADITPDYLSLYNNVFGPYSFDISKPSAPAVGDTNSNTSVDDKTFNCFVQIGDNTLLTKLRVYLKKTFEYEIVGSPSGDQHYLRKRVDFDLFVWHMKNSNYSYQGRTILERGRFFEKGSGNDLSKQTSYNVTVLGFDHGFNDDIVIQELNMPAWDFIGGAPYNDDGSNINIRNSALDKDPYFNPGVQDGDVIDLLGNTIYYLDKSLFAHFYNNASNADNFEASKAPSNGRYAFWADILMFGWLNQEVTEILVNLATQLNCYLFYNEAGKVALQDRLLYESYLPGSLPPNAFEVDLADIQPLGSKSDQDGFNSYDIEYSDRIEINNVASDETVKVPVDKNGIRNTASNRSTNYNVKNYRTSDLGVPALNDPVGQLRYRYSPDDPNFGISGVSLSDFIPKPVHQAQQFARSWSYPVITWRIQWDIHRYPDAGIGQYFYVNWGNTNKVYFIRQITHDPDQMLHKLEVQEIGVYSP